MFDYTSFIHGYEYSQTYPLCGDDFTPILSFTISKKIKHNLAGVAMILPTYLTPKDFKYFANNSQVNPN